MISSPGIYGLPADEYHADPSPEPSLSAANAWILETECPAELRWQHPRFNPTPRDKSTKALDIGRAAHMLALEPERFEVEFFVLPPDHSNRTKEGKALVAEAEDAGKTVISASDRQALDGMAEALRRSEVARLAFSAGKPEQSLFWKDRETGVWCRARPDWLPDNPLVIPDYKTAVSVNPRKFERQACDLGHHVRAAHYLAGIEAIFGRRPLDYLFVVQRKTPPYPVVPIILHVDAVEWGEKIRRRALRLFARCLETDRWPGYAGEDPIVIGLPGYEQKRLSDLESFGYFDKEPPHEQAPDTGADHPYCAG